MSDDMVKATQTWLNSTYGSVDGWVQLDENGETGWDTIYGLRRGLQTELGISPVASGFGPATTEAFQTQIGQIDTNTTSVNLLRLVSGSLWCKGYSGFSTFADDPDTEPITFDAMAGSVAKVFQDLGLATGPVLIDVKLMASLMSMDAYVIPPGTSGTEKIRLVQQWLNGMYASRQNFAILPADGSYSRQIETGLIYALQYEFGMSDDVANGNFGPGTQADLKEHPLAEGDADLADGPFLVHLYQGALRFNGYDAPFSGAFDTETSGCTSDFQAFMELPVTGAGDYGTWCALLVSTGDPGRAVTGFDTSAQLTNLAYDAKAAGYTHVGRYTVGTEKYITSEELAALKDAGLALFPIHQRYNNDDSYMTEDQGRTQGIEALERCRALDIPDGSTIFFSVDYDPIDTSISGPVTSFFTGINKSMNDQILGQYKIGVYGTRNVCQAMLDANLASTAFVAGMSTGWSGNMGFRMPEKWGYNQILETQEVFGAYTVDLDHVVVSSINAPAVDLSGVTPPPTEKDGAPSATGFDAVYEWIVSAEATCERALTEASTAQFPTQNDASQIPNYILGWLRKPAYWTDGKSSAMWQAYTPESSTDTIGVLARGACEDALSNLTDIRQTTEVWNGTAYVAYYRDLAHMAASTLGYMAWGVEETYDASGLGDLGGWPLDLLQIWGNAQGSSSDLATYLSNYLGVVNAPKGGFNFADLSADADAWLIARALKSDTSGRGLSNALRSLYAENTKDRITRFYFERFGASDANILKAFNQMLEVAVHCIVGIPALFAAAGVSDLPSADDQATLAEVLAVVLANPTW